MTTGDVRDLSARLFGHNTGTIAGSPVISNLNKLPIKTIIQGKSANQTDPAMKKLIFVVILAAAGYWGYQYVYLPSHQSSQEEAPSTSGTSTYVPEVPEECQGKAREYENAVYSADSPRTSFAQRNYAERAFMTCLKDSGFSDQQINAKLAEIKERVKGWVQQDGGVK
jgi:hypothetical protein